MVLVSQGQMGCQAVSRWPSYSLFAVLDFVTVTLNLIIFIC